jgi:hypothetical protein
MRPRSLFLAGLAAVTLGGCSGPKDGYFANPCDSSITIRTYGGDIDQQKPADALAEAKLPPATVTKVHNAFDTVGDVFTVEVVGTTSFKITSDEMPKWFVAIPARACPS